MIINWARLSFVSYWREKSIKTRIETEYRPHAFSYLTRIEEKNPLKQGLKPWGVGAAGYALGIEEKNPLKQGLKHELKAAHPAICEALKRKIH